MDEIAKKIKEQVYRPEVIDALIKVAVAAENVRCSKYPERSGIPEVEKAMDDLRESLK